MWAISTELDKTVKSIEQKRIRDTDQGGTGLDHYDDNSKVMVVEIRWFEREVFYLIADEETQTKLQISEAQYQHMLKNAKKLEARLPGIQVMPTAARMTRKVYRRAFLGIGDGTNPPRETRTRQRVASEAFAEDQTKAEAETPAGTLADALASAETGAARHDEAAVEGCGSLNGCTPLETASR